MCGLSLSFFSSLSPSPFSPFLSLTLPYSHLLSLSSPLFSLTSPCSSLLSLPLSPLSSLALLPPLSPSLPPSLSLSLSLSYPFPRTVAHHNVKSVLFRTQSAWHGFVRICLLQAVVPGAAPCRSSRCWRWCSLRHCPCWTSPSSSQRRWSHWGTQSGHGVRGA